MTEILKEATSAIKTHPHNFLYTAEVQRVFRALEQGIKDRTEETETLMVSIPTDKVPDKLQLLPLPVTECQDGTISFDWFTLSENKMGFADVASVFVSTLIEGLNELPSSKIPSKDAMSKIKQKYIPGMKLRVNKMADDYGIPEGTIVTVDFVDDIGQIHVKESGLAVIPGVDEFEVMK